MSINCLMRWTLWCMASPDLSTEFKVDKRLVRRSFDKAASGYDRAAVLQKLVEQKCLERLSLLRLQPERILDLGCGTGRASQLLMDRYRKAEMISTDLAPAMLRLARKRKRWWRPQRFVCLDAECLPFAPARFDLIFSSLVFQWVNDLDRLFDGLFQSLRPNGLLLFATFGPDTLRELRAAWRQVDDDNHVGSFIDMHDIGDALGRAGFESPVLDVEKFTLTYDNLIALARDLKAIGAHNVTAGRSRALTGRQRWLCLEAAYEAFRQDRRLPATYEVTFAHAWKPLTGNSTDSQVTETELRFFPRNPRMARG